MIRSYLRVLVLALAFVSDASAQAGETPAEFWVTPTVPGFGPIHEFEGAAYVPDKARTYKVVFALTKGVTDPHEITPGLESVARAVNLYVYAGVPLSHLKFVVIANGDTASLALDDAHYTEKFGTRNPNLALIAELRKVGVDVVVCGQAVVGNQYDYNWIDKSVTIALSAVTTITGLQQRGYALMPL